MSAVVARRRGLSLIEALLSILVLAGAVAIAAGAIGSTLPQSMAAPNAIAARELAGDLLEEVMARPFDDPAGADGETTRASFDDADDYGGYTESPPADPSGAAIAGAGAFTRSVAVVPVTADDLDAAPGEVARPGATLLRVEVSVTWPSGQTITLAGLKAQASPGVLPRPRSGFIYVPGTRNSGNGEHLIVTIEDRLGRPITVDTVRVYWDPPDVMYFKYIEVDGTRVAERQPLFARGEAVTLTPPQTFQPNVGKSFDGWHFRENADGRGPAGNLRNYTFTILFGSGSETYQVDIPIGD